MLQLRKKGRPAHWPFFLLIVAWACANNPQSIAFEAFLWIKGARHFSHQQQLKADVAFLLAGKNMKAVLATAQAPVSVPANSIPEDAVVKKIDLSAPSGREVFLGQEILGKPIVYSITNIGFERSAPPYQPPRVV
jgi:hypothetical protein